MRSRIMTDIFISHYYNPANSRAAYVALLKSGTHQKIFMKAFRICNESRIVFHAMCESMEHIQQDRRAGEKIKFHTTHISSSKIIKNRYIFRWAHTGFKDAGKESHPDLFKRFVKLTDEFAHVGIMVDPADTVRVEQAKENTEDVENLFEDEFWEKHHGMLM